MGNFVLSCCSTADLTKEHFEKRNIKYICFHFELDGKQYIDDLGESIAFPDFYNAMANGAETKTSQVNVDEFVEYFTPFLEAGQDILHVSLSSGISGSYNSANVAREILSEKYPDRKIYVIDSLGASSGFGLLMELLADKRDQGMNIDDLAKYAEETRLHIHHWFFSTDLTFFIKGGRISKSAGFVGSLLNICPLLNVNNEGKLIPRYKIRGKKRVIEAIVDKMEENAKDGLNYSGKVFISQSACVEDAEKVKALIKERFKNIDGDVEIYYIGTTIGSHTGPGTVALFFEGGLRGE